MHRILVAILNLAEHEQGWIISSGSLTFCEEYLRKYHTGEFETCDFAPIHLEVMNTTIKLAQNIVSRLV